MFQRAMLSAMTATASLYGKWNVLPDLGRIHMKTSRVGLISVNAHAPIIGGFADWLAHKADLAIDIGIGNISTGNALLDPEVRSLINKGSDGVLRFVGAGHATNDELRFEGHATAGNIVVPIVLLGRPGGLSEHDVLDIVLSGTATFEDIKLPLPGFGHVKKIDVHIAGDIKLVRGED